MNDVTRILRDIDQGDPRAAIDQLVAYSTALLERAGDLIMVSVEAAASSSVASEESLSKKSRPASGSMIACLK